MSKIETFSKREVRTAFAALGYTLSMRANPLNGAIGNFFVAGNGLAKEIMISSAGVFTTAFFEQHRSMFNVAKRYRGHIVGNLKIL